MKKVIDWLRNYITPEAKRISYEPLRDNIQRVINDYDERNLARPLWAFFRSTEGGMDYEEATMVEDVVLNVAATVNAEMSIRDWCTNSRLGDRLTVGGWTIIRVSRQHHDLNLAPIAP